MDWFWEIMGLLLFLLLVLQALEVGARRRAQRNRSIVEFDRCGHPIAIKNMDELSARIDREFRQNLLGD